MGEVIGVIVARSTFQKGLEIEDKFHEDTSGSVARFRDLCVECFHLCGEDMCGLTFKEIPKSGRCNILNQNNYVE